MCLVLRSVSYALRRDIAYFRRKKITQPFAIAFPQVPNARILIIQHNSPDEISPHSRAIETALNCCVASPSTYRKTPA